MLHWKLKTNSAACLLLLLSLHLISILGGLGQRPPREDGLMKGSLDIFAAQSLEQVEEDVKRVRIEVVKENILKQLHMKSRPPKVNRAKVVIPHPVLEAVSVTKYYYVDKDTTQAILRPNPITQGPTIICGFNWSSSMLRARQIQHAKLSVYKLANEMEPRVYEYVLRELLTGIETRHQAPNIYGGWISFDITNVALAITKASFKQDRILFVLSCPKCDDGDRLTISETPEFSPYIAIDVTHKSDARKRRAVDECDDRNTSCCKRSFKVNFEKIDWHDWVVAPAEFHANYCHGLCTKDASYQNAHRSVMSRLTGIGDQHWYFSTCCVAKRYSTISLLYLDEDGMLYKKEISDMSVEECGCA